MELFVEEIHARTVGVVDDDLSRACRERSFGGRIRLSRHNSAGEFVVLLVVAERAGALPDDARPTLEIDHDVDLRTIAHGAGTSLAAVCGPLRYA